VVLEVANANCGLDFGCSVVHCALDTVVVDGWKMAGFIFRGLVISVGEGRS